MTHIKIEKGPVHSVEHTGRSQLVVFIGRLFIQFFHQMRNHTVAAESVVLLVDIPHDLTVGDGVVSVLHVTAVTFIGAIPEQRDHCLPDRLLVVISLLQLLELSVVLPGNHAQRKYAQLLHPVLLDDLLHGIPVHIGIPPLYLYPGAPTVVIGGHLHPGSSVVIIDRALHPRAAIVVPDGRGNIDHRDRYG